MWWVVLCVVLWWGVAVGDAQPHDPRLVLQFRVETGLAGGVRWREQTNRAVGTLTDMASPPSSTSGWGQATVRQGGEGETRYDGNNDYVLVPAHAAYTITSNITLMAWVKLAALGEYGAILAKTAANDTLHDFMMVMRTSNAFAFYSTATDYEDSTTTVPDTNWHHLAISRIGSTLSYYLDGKPAGTKTDGTALGDHPTYSVYIGTDRTLGAGAVNFFRGALDDVRVYNQGLTSAEVQAAYQQSLALPPSGPQVRAESSFLAALRRIKMRWITW